MLIKDLPAPIRKLAEKRFIEFVTPYKNISNDVNSAYIDSFSWSKTEKYGEGPSFWISIHNGNFTPYYAMYGLPEKWCIKCLHAWCNNIEPINSVWKRVLKDLGKYAIGICINRFYHKGYGIYSEIQKGYTEITLSDWLAANPEKKEDAELNKIYNLEGFVKLENKECVIPEELNKMKSPQFDPINKPKHYNSHPSGIECIEITQHHNYCIGNSIKYLWRQGLKDGESNIKDLMKARKCIDLEIERIKKFENSGK